MLLIAYSRDRYEFLRFFYFIYFEVRAQKAFSTFCFNIYSGEKKCVQKKKTRRWQNSWTGGGEGGSRS